MGAFCGGKKLGAAYDFSIPYFFQSFLVIGVP